MIVRYAKERGYQGQGKDPHLTLGKDYIALGVNFGLGSYPYEVSIQSDSDGTPGIWDLCFFNIIDHRLPNGWAFTRLGSGYYRLTAEEFLGDFWDRYHDGNEEAEKVFNEVVKKLKAFHER